MQRNRLYLLSFLIVLATCYVYERDFALAELKVDNGWLYLDSFIFKPSEMKMDVRLAFIGKGESKTHKMFLQFVPSQKWANQIENKCRSGLNIPLIVEPLRMNGQVQYNTINFGVQKEETYHLVIKDCIQSFRKDYDNPNGRVFLRLTMRDGKDAPFAESLLTANQQNQIERLRLLAINSAETQQEQNTQQRSDITDTNSTPTNEANPAQSINSETTGQL